VIDSYAAVALTIPWTVAGQTTTAQTGGGSRAKCCETTNKILSWNTNPMPRDEFFANLSHARLGLRR
jgi:hypothetical protein